MINRLEPFAAGYMGCKSDHVSMKIACGMYELCKHIPLTMDTEVGLAYLDRSRYGAMENLVVNYRYGNGIKCKGERIEGIAAKHPEYPECAEQLKAIEEYFLPLDTQRMFLNSYTKEEKPLTDNQTLWGGHWGGHANPDYDLLLRLGTSGLREKIEQYRAVHPEAGEWYDASRLVLDGLDILGERFRKLALQLAEEDPAEKEIYLKIAKALETVPKCPAYDFMSACQMFFLVFTFDGNDSPGTFDQYMIEYYNKTEKEEARRILEGLWIGFHKVRAWNLCISGSDENWNDKTNALSYEILDVAAKYRYNTPNLTMRRHRNTPETLMDKAISVLETGIGMPVIYNDEVVCPALEALGIPPEDSHLYAMNGCNQFDIQGKSHMGLEDGEVCLLKCLEYALFDGKCQISGEKVSISTGNAAEFASFEELMEAYKKQVEYAVKVAVGLANRAQQMYAEYAPNPLRSILIQGCLEKGKDYKAGGPWYNHGQILTEGLADTVDSLYSIKHFVFDTGEYTMAEVVDALEKDFNGYEEMYRKFRKYPNKFGNDCEEVDSLGGQILEHYFKELMKYRTYRGKEEGIYGGGLSTFNRTAGYGASCGASANGRHKGDGNIADSIGATPGMDVNGPTAAINSVLRYDQKLAKSGFVFQLKFDQTVFGSENGRKAFAALAKTYFQNGGQQMTVNVLNQKDLLDAMEHPENYQNLVVRVGGYSDYFVNLERGLQENIIARTIQAM